MALHLSCHAVCMYVTCWAGVSVCVCVCVRAGSYASFVNAAKLRFSKWMRSIALSFLLDIISVCLVFYFVVYFSRVFRYLIHE